MTTKTRNSGANASAKTTSNDSTFLALSSEPTASFTTENQAPEANDDEFTVEEGGYLSVINYSARGGANNGLTSNDSDPEDDELTIVAVNGEPIDGIYTQVTGSNGGLFTIYANGTAYLSAQSGFDYLKPGETATTSITYTLEDSEGNQSVATVTMVVTGTAGGNEAPTAEDDTVTIEAGSFASLLNMTARGGADNGLLANDTDPEDDALTVVAVNGISLSGSYIQVFGSQGGLFTIYSNGSAYLNAKSGFEDLEPGEQITTSVTYTIEDAEGNQSTATLTMIVDGGNAAPEAVDDTAETNEDNSVIIDVLANDSDANAGDTIRVVSAQAAHGDVIILSNGALEYRPDPDFFGEDTITYVIKDDAGLSSQASVEVTVVGQPDDPIANDDETTMAADDDYVALDLLSNDEEVDGQSLTVVSVDGSSSSIGSPVAGNAGGYWVIESDGEARFYTDGDFLGMTESSVTESITYTVEDSDGDQSVATASVTIEQTEVAPVAVDDFYVVEAGTTGAFLNLASRGKANNGLTGNDSDANGDALTIVAVNGQSISGGYAQVSGSDGGIFTIYANGSTYFNARDGFDDLAGNDIRTSTAEYTLEDSSGLTSTATVEVSIMASENDYFA